MFYQIRYQTGELDDVVKEMKNHTIPCMDVDNSQELDWVIDQLSRRCIYKVEDIPYDKQARDKLKEPEFEYRIAFFSSPAKANEVKKEDLMYIDFYFEPEVEETYDSIFGD